MKKVQIIEIAEGEEHTVLFVPRGGTRTDKYGSTVIADTARSKTSCIGVSVSHPDNGSTCYTWPVSPQDWSNLMANEQAGLFDPEAFLYALGSYLYCKGRQALRKVQRLFESLDPDRLGAVQRVLDARFGDDSGGSVALKNFAARTLELYNDGVDDSDEGVDDFEADGHSRIENLLAALPPEADQSPPERPLLDVIEYLIKHKGSFDRSHIKGYFTCSVHGCKRHHANGGKGFGSAAERIGESAVNLKLVRHNIKKHGVANGGLLPKDITNVRDAYYELLDRDERDSDDGDDEGRPPAR